MSLLSAPVVLSDQYKYTPGSAGKAGWRAIPSRPRSDAEFTADATRGLFEDEEVVRPQERHGDRLFEPGHDRPDKQVGIDDRGSWRGALGGERAGGTQAGGHSQDGQYRADQEPGAGTGNKSSHRASSERRLKWRGDLSGTDVQAGRRASAIPPPQAECSFPFD
jgi:hypothetical protein